MAEATIMDVVNIFDPGNAAYGYWDVLPLIAAALFSSIVLLAFIYMWGTLFRDNNLINLVNSTMQSVFLDLHAPVFLRVSAPLRLKKISENPFHPR